MDYLIEFLLKAVPLAGLLESAGLSKEMSVVAAAVIWLGILYGAARATTALWHYYKTCKAAKDLAPYFYKQQVKKSRRFFIPTQAQNESPAREDEPDFTHKYVFKEKLIPFFINKGFDEEKTSDKFYLVLADSGMGKTTFMINLYVRYNSFNL